MFMAQMTLFLPFLPRNYLLVWLRTQILTLTLSIISVYSNVYLRGERKRERLKE